MNVRISQGELRFRVTREELERLLLDRTLTMDVSPFLQTAIRIGANNGIPLRVTREDTLLSMTVSEASARALLAALPSRQGLEVRQIPEGAPPLTLLLEVDIRSQKRKRE